MEARKRLKALAAAAAIIAVPGAHLAAQPVCPTKDQEAQLKSVCVTENELCAALRKGIRESCQRPKIVLPTDGPCGGGAGACVSKAGQGALHFDR